MLRVFLGHGGKCRPGRSPHCPPSQHVKTKPREPCSKPFFDGLSWVLDASWSQLSQNEVSIVLMMFLYEGARMYRNISAIGTPLWLAFNSTREDTNFQAPAPYKHNSTIGTAGCPCFSPSAIFCFCKSTATFNVLDKLEWCKILVRSHKSAGNMDKQT